MPIFVSNDIHPLNGPLQFGPSTSSYGVRVDQNDAGAASLPEITGVAVPGTRRAIRVFNDLMLTQVVTATGIGFAIQGTDNTTMTTIKGLRAKVALMSSDGPRYQGTKTGMPAQVLRESALLTLSQAAAEGSTGTAVADRYSQFFFPFTDGAMTLIPGRYWVQLLIEVQYANETPNSVWFGAQQATSDSNLFNPGSVNESGFFGINLENDIATATFMDSQNSVILSNPSSILTSSISSVTNLGGGSGWTQPQSSLHRIKFRFRGYGTA